MKDKKDKKAVKAVLTNKGKGKNKAVPKDTTPQEVDPKDTTSQEVEPKDTTPQEVEPQDAGCEVTDENIQCTLLIGTYAGLDPLR